MHEPEDQPAHDLTELLGSLKTLLISTSGVEAFLAEVATLACAVVDPPASCGITSRYDHRPVTVASSDQRAARIDEVQYASGEGPCVQALDTGEVVEVADQRADSRWPAYREAALEHGVAWVMSTPLSVASKTVGVLNLYGYDQPFELESRQRQRVETFAAQASTALTIAIQHSEQQEMAAQLEEALASRSTIDQALGIIMAQAPTPPAPFEPSPRRGA